ncbi:MAG TPA: glutamine amidotransferase [Solirubrobacteraceae bacterium]|nr:glutamine amidotransferase [Solirubrobacteraceae bacterium]
MREQRSQTPTLRDTPADARSERTLRVCALYPDLMNIYADRGNLIVLERRCAWRGIGFQLSASGLGEELDGGAHDLVYIGGGQDRDQRLCARDLIETKRAGLHAAAARGAVVLGVCGGYQLLGHSYTLGREQIPGVGLLDVHTVRADGPRLIGNVAIEVRLEQPARRAGARTGGREAQTDFASAAREGGPRVLAGFENHGGRTRLDPGQKPLGSVLRGFGNDGRSGVEGARTGATIGTYLHGPLLPKNVWFADWLIASALGVEPGELTPLDDAIEHQTHLSARRAAGV